MNVAKQTVSFTLSHSHVFMSSVSSDVKHFKIIILTLNDIIIISEIIIFAYVISQILL